MAVALLTISCGSAAPQVQPGAPPTPTGIGSSAASTLYESATSVPDGDVRWVSIAVVTARVDAPTTLKVAYDVCDQVPPPRVIESATEVRLIIDKQHDYAGIQLACQAFADVHLAQPIGERKVIDDRNGRAYTVIVEDPPVKPANLKGGVRDVLGQEGDATVTAWLLIDQTGAAKLCDDLPPTASTCPTPTIAVDWESGGATPPSDLLQRGAVRVSNGPITLRGSLKVEFLYVGIVP
jgi:hypothetical protein